MQKRSNNFADGLWQSKNTMYWMNPPNQNESEESEYKIVESYRARGFLDTGKKEDLGKE